MRISTILTPSPLYLKGPEATLVAKLPWRAVLHLPQGLGPSLIESVASSPGTRRFGHQSIHASGVEVVDGVTHRLLAASEVRRYLGDLISPRRSQEHLRTAQGESVFGALPGFEGLALSIRKQTYKDWSFHGYYCNSQSEIYAEDALIPGGEHQAHEGRNKS